MTPIGIQLKLGGDREVEQGLLRVRGAMDNVGSAAGSLTRALGGIGGAFAGVLSVREFVQAADAVTSLQNQLKLATGGAQQAAQAYGALFDIAQRSRVSFIELGGTFASIARATGELGISQQRLLTVTEAIGNAVTISGTGAQAANAALVQLGQGLASGTLRGEELNSVMEQTPRLAKALADGLGVTTGELRKLGAEGAITAQQVIKALESQAGVLQGEVKDATLTVGQAFTQLKNSAVVAVGDFDKATGASQSLAHAMSGLAGVVTTVGEAVRNNEGAFATLAGGIGGAAAVAGVVGLGVALVKVGGAVAALGAVLVANPAVLALLGVGVAAGAGIAALRASTQTADGIQRAIDQLRQENERSEAAYARAVAGGREAGAANILRVVQQRKDEILKLQAELDSLNAGAVGGGRGTVNPETVGAMNARQAAQESELVEVRRKLYGVDKDYLPTLEKLHAQYSSGKLTLEGYRDLVGKLADANFKRDKSGQNAYDALNAQVQAYKNADKAILDSRKDFYDRLSLQVKLGTKSELDAAEESIAAEESTWAKRQANFQAEMAAAGAKKNSAADVVRITGQMQEAERDYYQNIAKLRADALLSELQYGKALEDRISKQQAAAEAVQEQVRLAQLEGKAIGLTGDALREHNQALVEEKAGRLEYLAGTLAAIDGSGALAKAYLGEAVALRTLHKEQGENRAAQMVYEYKKGVEDSNKLLQAELGLMGLSEQAREISLEQLRIQLDLETKIAAIKASMDDTPERAKRIAEVEAAAAIAKANVSSKVFLDDWKRSVQQYDDIFRQGFADMLNRGEDGWNSFTKSLATTFKTTVADTLYKAFAQPFVVRIVGQLMGLAGGVGGAAVQAASGGSNVQGMAGNVASLFGAGGIGGSLMAGAGWLTGATTFGGALGAGASLIGTGTMAGAMSGIGMIAGALGPIALGVAALTSLIGGLDDSGTPHAGAGAVYSGGSVTGGRDVYSYDRFDLADMNTYSDQVQGLVSPVAQSIGAALDAFATAFGQQAGYTVSTAFADDSSKDASWGALRIEDALGQVLVDWNSDRQSKWAPREFSDGEQGQKEYLAAIARDTRQVLLDMDLPSWADEILESIGDTADMDALTAAMTQIGKVQTSFEQLGASMQMFAGITDELQAALMGAAGGIDALVNSAGAFYQGFYTEAERMDALRGQLNTALSGLDLTIDPNMGDDAKAQFRQAVEDAMAAGDAELAASLLAISGNFATAADYFEQLSRDAAEAAKKSAEDARKALIDSTYDMFRRLVDRDRDLLSSQASAISEVIGQISTSVDMLKSNARDLYGTVDSTAQMLAAQGMVYIEDALAGVRGGASITGYTGLQDAVTAARGGINSGVYVSQFERDRDALVLAGQLAEMAELGDVQLSVQERQLRAVNEQLEYLDTLSKRADDLVNGNTELTGTVQSNFDRLLALLDPQSNVGDAAGKSSSAFAIGGSAPGGGGSGGAPYDKAADVRNMVGLQLQLGADKGLGHEDDSVLRAINAARYGTGITQADIANAYGVPVDDIERLFAGAGISRFATGAAFTNGVVSRPTFFNIGQMGEGGQSEGILPLANVGGRLGVYAMGGNSGNSERLERLVEALTVQNARLETRLAAIEGHAKKQADQFESYSNGGTFSRQKAMA